MASDYLYTPEACPGHRFGSNDGQPIDDHCSRCGTLWPPRDGASEANAKEALRRARESEARLSPESGGAHG